MAKKPNLKLLHKLFEQGRNFSLTEAQYEEKTGARLPKQSSYLLKSSALAKACKENGYSLRLQEKIVFMEKEK